VAPVEADSVLVTVREVNGAVVPHLAFGITSAAGTDEFSTDAEGVLAIPPKHRLGVSLNMLDDAYMFSTDRLAFSQGKTLPNFDRLTDNRYEVTVYSLLTYDVQVRYADGVPWEGDMLFAPSASAQFQTIPVRAGQATGLVVADGAAAHCGVDSLRKGFSGSGRSWIGGDADPGVPIEITLPTGGIPTFRTFFIDLRAFEAGESVNVMKYEVRRNKAGKDMPISIGASANLGGAVHKIGYHSAPKYGVTVTNGKVAWTSGTFSMEEGEMRTLVPELKACATLKARVLTPQGDPVPGARMWFRQGRYPSWERWKEDQPGTSTLSGLRCTPDADGYCELPGLPAGDIEIEISSPDRGPYIEVVHLEPGETRDIGEILLDYATGSIEIQLSGFDTRMRFEAYLRQPGGLAVTEAIPLNEFGYLKMEHVAPRTYILMVRSIEPGRVTWRYIDLTQAEPGVHLDIDLTK
jgi:hypothetical protein